ncbi:hypothetical protein GCM10010919_17200 [Alishewanella longhuensis]|uniref:Lcl C-terminal domain-containing protein n=1 Tax=Alishewanella longhuensis TaxID=1091037 RepID=A0ABQ3KYT0_9ALTE|nr:DUF1566 domain-containing protein [Alishewanella longhuensis]GHG68055.1 hypothetical protein GCM10010919_17200 [Alishewanella longhuensis]
MKPFIFKLYAVLLALFSMCSAYAALCPNENQQVRATTPTEDFILFENGTAIHKRTGLMWMRCSNQQVWDGAKCIGNSIGATWANALVIAEQSDFASYTDWRLPNIKELQTIIEARCLPGGVNEVVFPIADRVYYSDPDEEIWLGGNNFWSATTTVFPSAYGPSAWIVHFNSASTSFTRKGTVRSFRLVREVASE